MKLLVISDIHSNYEALLAVTDAVQTGSSQDQGENAHLRAVIRLASAKDYSAP